MSILTCEGGSADVCIYPEILSTVIVLPKSSIKIAMVLNPKTSIFPSVAQYSLTSIAFSVNAAL